MNAIEKELAKATKITAKDGEERQDYLARLIRGANALVEKDWNKLSEPAQEWANTGVQAITDKKAIPDFDAETPAEDKPAKKAVKGAKAPKEEAEEKPAKKAVKAPKEKTEEEPKAKKKAHGVTATVCSLVLRHPDWKRAQVREALDKKGVECSKPTLDTVFHGTHLTLQVQEQLAAAK